MTNQRTRTQQKNDYVIFKLDVEGEEYPILEDLTANSDVVELIDLFYGEYHSFGRGKYKKYVTSFRFLCWRERRAREWGKEDKGKPEK